MNLERYRYVNPLGDWDRGFISHPGHGSTSAILSVLVLSCADREALGLADPLSKVSYQNVDNQDSEIRGMAGLGLHGSALPCKKKGTSVLLCAT
jgi:hypothetical protein